jgi:hypothetical protein
MLDFRAAVLRAAQKRHKKKLHLLTARAGGQGINLSVDSLQAAMRRVRAEVMQPYASIRMQTSQLHNLHTTADVLRHVLHRLKLVARLKVSPPDPFHKTLSCWT